MDMAHGTHDKRMAAAHATLSEAVGKLSSSEDWQNLLTMAGSFHRYSPNNQLLLAAQGAQGLVASFHTWKQLQAEDGEACRIRKGETALRVYAPIKGRREVDPNTGELTEPGIVGYRLVPVFHQGQLVSPPDLPAQPRLLTGEEPSPEWWDAVASQITDAGFKLERGSIAGTGGAKGVTNYTTQTVMVRDDLAPPQALKTQIHELAHVLMHGPEVGETKGQGRIEVEAESVAYVVCDLLGVDAGEYSIPYVASWAAGDPERVQETAHAVLGTARRIVSGLEAELGVDLRPNPIADALNTRQPQQVARASDRPPAIGTTDQIIYQHVTTGDFDWHRLAASIPALDHMPGQIAAAAGAPAAQATMLAEAGASAFATAQVLRCQDVDDNDIRQHMSVTVQDASGSIEPLFHPHEVIKALKSPRPFRPLADKMVADLLVAAGRHPTAARHLAETSGQPSNVIDLMEERLRRSGHPSTIGFDRRSERGLTLIDEWTGNAPASAPGPEPVAPTRPPEPPQPAA